MAEADSNMDGTTIHLDESPIHLDESPIHLDEAVRRAFAEGRRSQRETKEHTAERVVNLLLFYH